MREITIKLYNFSELSEDAQRRAWLDYTDNLKEFPWESEYRATLEAFEKAFDIDVKYSVDENAYYYEFNQYREAPEGDWLRFAKWVHNNFSDVILTGKYYGKLIHNDGKPRHVKRYSKATFEYTCCFTGFFADMAITDPVWKCIHYKEKYTSYEDLIFDCLESFFETWRNELEYETSIECFQELCDINDWEFYETGEMV